MWTLPRQSCILLTWKRWKSSTKDVKVQTQYCRELYLWLETSPGFFLGPHEGYRLPRNVINPFADIFRENWWAKLDFRAEECLNSSCQILLWMVIGGAFHGIAYSFPWSPSPKKFVEVPQEGVYSDGRQFQLKTELKTNILK